MGDAAPPIPARARRAILLLVAATTLASALGSAFLPYLAAQQPVLLLLSGSDARNLVLATPRLDLPVLLVVAVPRRALGMIATYGLGLLYGQAALAWSAKRFPRVTRFFDRVVALFETFERASLVLWPTYTTTGLAGVRRMAWSRYVPWMLVGQTAYVLAWVKVGDAMSGWTERAIKAVSPYLVEATVVSVVVVVGYQAYVVWRKRRGEEVEVRGADQQGAEEQAADEKKGGT